jgi:ATP-dependent Lon protease
MFICDQHLHDRQISMVHGWMLKIGRGFDICQRIDRPCSGLGVNGLGLRPCLETIVDFFREGK